MKNEQLLNPLTSEELTMDRIHALASTYIKGQEQVGKFCRRLLEVLKTKEVTKNATAN
jgi:uncharacterized membrane-anchored protein